MHQYLKNMYDSSPVAHVTKPRMKRITEPLFNKVASQVRIDHFLTIRFDVTTINDFIFQANASNELPIDLSNTTRIHLQDLHYDFLLQIFSVKTLTPIDLCAVVEACPSFKEIIEYLFPKKWTIFNGEFKSEHYVSKKRRNDLAYRTDTDRIFRNFGSLVSAIAISGRSSLDFFLKVLTKYDTHTLTELDISGLTNQLTIEWKPVFNRLEKLILCHVIIYDPWMFDDCNSLIELDVSLVTNGYLILEQQFPKLEKFSYYDSGDENDEDILSDFIARHDNLKSLRIDTFSIVLQTIHVMQQIGSSFKRLEKLTVQMSNINMDDLKLTLRGLDQLNELEIHLCGFEAAACIKQFEELKSLETLKVWYLCDDNRFIPALLRLKKLRKLHLYAPIGYTRYRYLAKLTKFHIRRLKDLEEFSISEEFLLDEETFNEIVKIVERRPHVLILKCKFYFPYDWRKCYNYHKVRLVRFTDCDYKV